MKLDPSRETREVVEDLELEVDDGTELEEVGSA